ncbi:hypothetical protein CEXT_206081 [Caerostris extrusa]|uniref:Uncharacterized protein n=1 Tax=Caerostris extrusa TaxID=172846 RepID=A0AAV4XP13_CAEEX|nr:hypothetical protein CEXT_206081 [Caerostris extrusa]
MKNCKYGCKSVPSGNYAKLYPFSFWRTCRDRTTCFVQPLDLIKNRMQLSGEGAKQKNIKQYTCYQKCNKK